MSESYNTFIGRRNIGREEGEKRMKVLEIYCVLSERYQVLADRAVKQVRTKTTSLYIMKDIQNDMYEYSTEDIHNKKEE